MTIDLRVNSEGLQQRIELVGDAIEGSAEAQFELGELCRTGGGWANRDLAEALNWYTLAARQGHANAQNNLAVMYQHGMAVPEDLAEAANWYRLSAEQGFAIAQYNLGECLLYGIGVDADAYEAAAYLHKAAAQGHIEALSELGDLYRWGHGVDKRIAIAAEMHTVAALAGDKSALGNLADYHGQIEAEAKGGSLLCALCLAKMYDRGLGVELSKSKMFAWLLWGDERGTRDDDADVREEHDDMRGFYGLTLADDIKDDAWALFSAMRAATPCNGGGKSKRRRKVLPKRKLASKAVAGG